MKNFPKEFDINICHTKATIQFITEVTHIYNEDIIDLTIAQNITKKHFILLNRDSDKNINFFHSTPGQGTRVATININEFEKAKYIFIILEWHPKEISLHIGSGKDNPLVSAIGKISDIQFYIDREGNLHSTKKGKINLQSFAKAGKVLFTPTAIQTWRDTVEAVKLLIKAKSDDGYLFESILANSILTLLVTGFEVYCKKRFLELEDEGHIPNTNKINDAFFSKKERETNILSILKEEAQRENKSLMEYLVYRELINFQNFKKCKLSFNKAYDIKFGEMGIDNSTLIRLQKLIKYRHKIIHNSPTLRIWNIEKHMDEELESPSIEKADQAIETFNIFIDKLHQRSIDIGV